MKLRLWKREAKSKDFRAREMGELNMDILKKVRDTFVEELVVHSEIPLAALTDKEARAILVGQHGRLFTWLPLASSMAVYLIEQGAGERVPMAVSHRIFDAIPGGHELLRHFFPNTAAMSFDELVSSFNAGKFTDVVVAPEGDNCNFGNGIDIEPFRSPRFIELAVLCDVPLHLAVHRGTEDWGREVSIPEPLRPVFKYLPYNFFPRVNSYGHFIFPLVGKVRRLEVRMKRYRVALKPEDLPRDPSARRTLLWREAEKVRSAMQEMVDEIKADWPTEDETGR